MGCPRCEVPLAGLVPPAEVPLDMSPGRRGHVPCTGPALGIMPLCPLEGSKNEHVPRKDGTEPAET